MYAYRSYGLSIGSDLELPGLSPASATASSGFDVVVRSGRVEGAPRQGSWYALGPKHSCLAWSGTCDIAVEHGERIVVDPHTTDERLVAHALLGPALALLLQQRGLYALHASAVKVGEEAIAFAGDSGVGKSSVALALARRGREILTDDIAALSMAKGEVRIARGPSSVRVWPEALRSIGDTPDAHAALHGGTHKRLVHVEGASDGAPEFTRLRRIYALRTSSSESSSSVQGLEKALVLLRHVYYPELLAGTCGPSELLNQCVELAEALDVRVVESGSHFSGRPEFLDLVESEAGA